MFCCRNLVTLECKENKKGALDPSARNIVGGTAVVLRCGLHFPTNIRWKLSTIQGQDIKGLVLDLAADQEKTRLYLSVHQPRLSYCVKQTWRNKNLNLQARTQVHYMRQRHFPKVLPTYAPVSLDFTEKYGKLCLEFNVRLMTCKCGKSKCTCSLLKTARDSPMSS